MLPVLHVSFSFTQQESSICWWATLWCLSFTLRQKSLACELISRVSSHITIWSRQWPLSTCICEELSTRSEKWVWCGCFTCLVGFCNWEASDYEQDYILMWSWESCPSEWFRLIIVEKHGFWNLGLHEWCLLLSSTLSHKKRYDVCCLNGRCNMQTTYINLKPDQKFALRKSDCVMKKMNWQYSCTVHWYPQRILFNTKLNIESWNLSCVQIRYT